MIKKDIKSSLFRKERAKAMEKDLSEIVSEIKDIKNKLKANNTYYLAKYGYKAWLIENKNKSTIEKLKFFRDYMKAYENCYG